MNKNKKLLTSLAAASAMVASPVLNTISVLAEDTTPVQETVTQEDTVLKELEKNAADKKEAVDSASKVLEESEAEKEAAQVSYDAADSSYNQSYQEYAQAKTEAKNYIDGEIQANKKLLEDLNQKVSGLEEEKESLKQQSEEIASKKAEAEKKLKDAQDRYEQLSASIVPEEVSEEIKSLQEEIAGLNEELSIAEAELASSTVAYDKAVEECTAAEEAYNVQHAAVVNASTAVEQATQERDAAQKRYQEASAAYNAAINTDEEAEMNSRLLEAEAELNLANIQLETVQGNLTAAQTALTDEQGKLDQAKQVLVEAETNRNAALEKVNGYKAENAEIQAQIDAKQAESDKKLEEIAAVEKEIADVQKEIDKLNSSEGDYETRLKAAEEKVASLKVAALNANAVLSRGVIAFYESVLEDTSLSEHERQDVEQAISVLKEHSIENLTGIENPTEEQIIEYSTNLGAQGDATSWDNIFKVTEEAMNEYQRILNEIHSQNGDSTDWYTAVKTCYCLMAAAQAQANGSSKEVAHTKFYAVGENLAYDSDSHLFTAEELAKDLFKRFYYDEKATYESDEYQEKKAVLDELTKKWEDAPQGSEEEAEAYYAMWNYYNTEIVPYYNVGHYQNIVGEAYEFVKTSSGEVKRIKSISAVGFASAGSFGVVPSSGYPYNYNHVFGSVVDYSDNVVLEGGIPEDVLMSFDEMLTKMHNFYDKYANAETEYNKAVAELEALKAEGGNAQKIAELESQIQTLNAQVSALNAQKNELEKDIAALNDSKHKEEVIAQASEDYNRAEQAVTEAENNVKTLESKVESAKNEVQEKESAVTNAKAQVQSCEEKIDSIRQEISEYNQELANLEKAKSEAEKEYNEKEKALEEKTNEMHASIREFEEAEKRFIDANSKASVAKQNLKDAEEQLTALEGEISDKEAVKEEKEKLLNDYSQTQADVVSAEEEVEELTKSVEVAQEKVAENETEVEKAKGELEKAKAEKERLEKVLAFYYEIISSVEGGEAGASPFTIFQLTAEEEDLLGRLTLSVENLKKAISDRDKAADLLKEEEEKYDMLLAQYQRAVTELKQAEKALYDYTHPKTEEEEIKPSDTENTSGNNGSSTNTQNQQNTGGADTGVDMNTEAYLATLAVAGITYLVVKKKEKEVSEK